MKLTKMYPNWFKSLKKEENLSHSENEKLYKDAMETTWWHPQHSADLWGEGNASGTYASREITPTGGIKYNYDGGVSSEHNQKMSPAEHMAQAMHHRNQANLAWNPEAHSVYPPNNLESTRKATEHFSHKAAASHHAAEAARKAFYNSYGLDHRVSPDEAESWKPPEFYPVNRKKLSGENQWGDGVIHHYSGSYPDTGEPISTVFYHYPSINDRPMNLRSLHDVHSQAAHRFRLKANEAFDTSPHSDPKENHDTVIGLLAAARDHQDAANMIRKILTEERVDRLKRSFKHSKERENFRSRFGHTLPEIDYA